MREYLTLHRSVFPSYLTIESGRIILILHFSFNLSWGMGVGGGVGSIVAFNLETRMLVM